MRIKRRSAVILALATAGALAVAGVAFATGNSTATFKFTPSNVPTTAFQAGQINVHTHTTYTGTTQTDQAKLNFDNDFKVNTSATPKCNKANIQGQIDMAAAMAACGSAKVGSGKATAWAGPNTIHACVLVFNGKKDAAGHPTNLVFTRAQSSPPFTINCANPATNHNGNSTVLLEGIIKSNPSSLGADFAGGRMVDFNHITQASPFPLTDFQVTVKRGNFISARCHDADHRLNIKAKFIYTDGQSDSVGSSQTCTVG